MPVSPQSITSAVELAHSLNAELDAFRDFVRLLQTEQESLVQGEIDNLIEFARLKSEKVILLSQLANRRNRFLATQGFDPEQGGMEKWLRNEHKGQDTALLASWKALLAEAKEAQHLNQTNAVMVETRLRNNQQALAALQAAAAQGGNTYGPDGQTHASALWRPLGKG